MGLFNRIANYLGYGIEVPVQPLTENFDKDETAEVVVVGGGPVGLWTAVLTKLQATDKKIVILEKHFAYQRGHVLQLDASSFKNIPQDPRLLGIVKDLVSTRNVRTNDIESKLKKLALELGIEFRQQNVSDPKKLKQHFPNVKFIIGADGSHSVTRKQIFGDKFQINDDLQYVAEVKYEVKGKAHKFSSIGSAYRTLKLMQCVATEHVGKEKNGITPVTLRIFINKDTYEAMKDKSSFKKPLNFSDDNGQIDEELMKNITIWMNAKKQIDGEEVVPGSQKVTFTHLAVYASEKVIKKEDGVWYALVGDSAGGVPFFRALALGNQCGTKLASSIAKNFRAEAEKAIPVKRSFFSFSKPSPDSYMEDFAKFFQKQVWWEIRKAKIKSFFINLYYAFVVLSGYVPWQFNKWSAAQARQFGRRQITNRTRVAASAA